MILGEKCWLMSVIKFAGCIFTKVKKVVMFPTDLGKRQKSSFCSGPATKRGEGGKGWATKKKITFFEPSQFSFPISLSLFFLSLFLLYIYIYMYSFLFLSYVYNTYIFTYQVYFNIGGNKN